jgi:hippurate hydrolase
MSRFTKMAFLFSSIIVCGAIPLFAQSDLDQRVAREMDSLVATYRHLHANPELSTQEKESSALLAAELRKFGYDVTDHFGRYDSPGLVSYGIVGVLRNGPGAAVYVRTDMDALPIVENTGLPYASHVKVKRADGSEVGVMHACGHDVHMSVFLGTARMLAELKDRWKGTLVLIGQPAEETVGGASAMLHAGLFTKFPKPDFVLALHDGSDLPAGKVGWHEGTILAGADSVDITVRGYGGQRSHRARLGNRHCSANGRQPRNGSTTADGSHRRFLSRRDQTQHHPRRSTFATDRSNHESSAARESTRRHRQNCEWHRRRCRHSRGARAHH